MLLTHKPAIMRTVVLLLLMVVTRLLLWVTMVLVWVLLVLRMPAVKRVVLLRCRRCCDREAVHRVS